MCYDDNISYSHNRLDHYDKILLQFNHDPYYYYDKLYICDDIDDESVYVMSW